MGLRGVNGAGFYEVRGESLWTDFRSSTIRAIISKVDANSWEEPVVAMTCVFCDIVRGAAPSSIVYADDLTMAFMDIQPINAGHMLIVPRNHASCLAELDVETGGRMFEVGMRLSEAVRRSGLRCEGVNLFLADGEAAGQEVFHVHLHLIPRYRGDGFGFRFGPEYSLLPERGSLDASAESIRQMLGG